MKRVENVAQLLIAKDISRAVSQEATVNDYTDLSDGEVAFVRPDGLVPDTDSGSGDAADLDQCPKLIAVQRSGTELLWSDVIDVNSVTNYSVETYSAATQQVDYVGYNSSTGSLDVIDETFFRVSLEFVPTDAAGFSRNLIKSFQYKSDASATQAEIAYGLLDSALANFGRDYETKDRILVERVLSSAGSTDLATSGNATGDLGLTKGSKYVSMTDSQDISVGDYLRFVSDGNVVDDTSAPVYKVTANDAANEIITLDVPYQGDSNADYDDAGVWLIPAATAATGDFGIKITAKAKEFFNPPQRLYRLVRFNTTLTDGFTSTTVTNSTAADRGVGTYREVAELERQLQDEERGDYENYPSNPDYRTDALSTETYDMLVLEFEDKKSLTVGGSADSKKQLYIALATTADPTAKQIENSDSGIITVLDEWLVDDFSVPGITKQNGNLTNT